MRIGREPQAPHVNSPRKRKSSPTSSSHAVAAVVPHHEPAARVEPGAPVHVRGGVEAVGVDEDAAAAASGEQVHDRLRLAVAVQVAQAHVLAGQRRLGGRAELLARLPDRLVVELLAAPRRRVPGSRGTPRSGTAHAPAGASRTRARRSRPPRWRSRRSAPAPPRTAGTASPASTSAALTREPNVLRCGRLDTVIAVQEWQGLAHLEDA